MEKLIGRKAGCVLNNRTGIVADTGEVLKTGDRFLLDSIPPKRDLHFD